MTANLSQAEIDALLSVASDAPHAARSAAASAGVVKYNFRRPDRVSKEQIYALQFLHERCARNLATSLSAYLRTTINMTVAAVAQHSYSDFLGSLTDRSMRSRSRRPMTSAPSRSIRRWRLRCSTACSAAAVSRSR